MKIIISGPESSGKTTLVEGLSTHYDLNIVAEYAREYLSTRTNGTYAYSDLLHIAKGQFEAISNSEISDTIIADTDLLTIKIWSEFKFNKCDPWIIKQLRLHKADLYLLCKPDIPWQADELRESPNDREELFEIYKREIESLNVPYVVISGQERTQRIQIAISAIDKLRNKKN